jgi:hypothetical protein
MYTNIVGHVFLQHEVRQVSTLDKYIVHMYYVHNILHIHYVYNFGMFKVQVLYVGTHYLYM